MQPVTLLIPHKELATLTEKDRALQRITATLLLLRSLYPEGRFSWCKMKEASMLCGFDSVEGFKRGHLDRLQKIGLVQYVTNEVQGIDYVRLADWKEIKKHYGITRIYFIHYELQNYSSRAVLAIIKWLAVQNKREYFKTSAKANLKNNPELREAIKTVCGGTDSETIHRYQIEAYTKGLKPGQTDEYYYAAYMVLHATKAPKSATTDEEKTAKRFYIKADYNVSVGYLSRAFGYARRNGFCYWKKQLESLGLAICQRREYTVDKRIRTTTETRSTGIGLNYYCPVERCLKLRLTDEWTFVNPAQALAAQPAVAPQQTAKK